MVLPSSAAISLRYVPEAHRGVVGGGFPGVWYPLSVAEGERIVVAVQGTGPGLKVQLMDPTGREREMAQGLPADRFELNAEMGGVWQVYVSNVLPTASDYLLTMTVAPNVEHGLDEGLDSGDAPGSCTGAHLIRSGAWPGGLWSGDASDVFRFSANRGDAVVAVLKPDELDDGADFSVEVLDAACAWIAGENFGPPGAKSAPDLTLNVPASRSGTHYLRVARVAGLGNYLLALDVTTTFPTLPGNDAGAGRDSIGSTDAIPLRVPGAYQGQFHDGDAFDWYRVARVPGSTLRVAIEPSVGSVFEVNAYDASSTLVASTIDDAPITFDVAHDAGPIHLRMRALVGGGNYMMELAERPAGT